MRNTSALLSVTGRRRLDALSCTCQRASSIRGSFRPDIHSVVAVLCVGAGSSLLESICAVSKCGVHVRA